MTALMHYLHTSPIHSAQSPSLIDRIWQRVRSAINGPAYDLAFVAH